MPEGNRVCGHCVIKANGKIRDWRVDHGPEELEGLQEEDAVSAGS